MKNKDGELRDVVLWAASFLAGKGIEASRLEAELLAAGCLDIDRASLLARMREPFPGQALELFYQLVERRGQHYPLQYLTGKQDFMGMEFFVAEGVLIPRGDTEVLVETVLELVSEPISKPISESGPENITRPIAPSVSKPIPKKILDVGTGSGIIAVSLAASLLTSRITAVDISPEALGAAATNAKKFGVDDRIDFVKADIFQWLPNQEYDVIVSNPPYITAEEMQVLQQEVCFEPAAALDGGEKGLEFYFRLADLATSPCLKAKGLVAVEIGWQQAEAVKGIFAQAGLKDITVVQDYGDRDRVVICRKG